MNHLFTATVKLDEFLRSQNFRYCFIGGIAVLRWGEPRMTADLDLTLFTGFGNEQFYVEALLNNFSARMSDAKNFALRHRTLLLSTELNIPIDISGCYAF